ncbi:cupin domain-containing protein [Pleurocapsa sp. PCC 7319]|uniref:cupin domain-containing protein n=1 Tax=Pleurocapsa sp. PCC 7319 TaxID=118161 RepID=UPI0003468E8B|nr:cupin domain-containing protein [Pleurocapsa sp. PCC 7319]
MNYIIRSNEIEAMEGLAKTHFLNENAKRTNKSLGDVVGLKNLGFHIIEVFPGYESTEYHVHHFEEECVYVLSGTATVTIDEANYEVRAGDFIGYPAGGLPHTMKNTGSEILRCIVVGQRLQHDVADYPRLGKRLYRYGQSNDLVDISDISHPTVGRKI